ncbi:MAG TPA: tripartite tricarboxylate transporter substrate-binding protein [Burkholderiaceae bacterium]|nr:tripartite tricarboxylate transporter substrate-binding protein [Burkholderiaceae bacterium]
MIHHLSNSKLVKVLLSATVLILALAANAQDKPALRILVGFPPSGSADTIARQIGNAMKDDYSSVTIDNKPGAAGRIALQQLKAAKPDGQTVIILPSGPMVLFPHVYKNVGYDAVKDFTPISLLARFQFGIVSGPSSNVKSITEMLAKAKTDKKSATYGTPGAGSLPHFLGVLLEQSAGVELTHVPFQGGAPANTALLGGHVGYKMDVISETAAFHRDGKVRIIAVTGSKRDAQVPEVPTLKEQGINMEATAWFAMYGPAGMSAQTLAKIEDQVRKAVNRPEVREQLVKLGNEPVGSTSQELATIQKADFARWEKPIKATGIQLD